MQDQTRQPDVVNTWTCARCGKDHRGRPKARWRAGGELCSRCVEAILAAKQVARCRAAVDPMIADGAIHEVKEQAETVAGTAADACDVVEVDDALRLEDELAEEPEIYELEPEADPVLVSAPEVADPVWNESPVMTWEDPVPVRRGVSMGVLLGLGTFVIVGLCVLAWSLVR